jgi:hypothetical protein
LKIITVDRISVSQQDAWSRVFRKRLDHLLRHSSGSWMFSDFEMNDLTSHVQKNNEAVNVSEGRGGDSKEIDADDLPSMSGEENLPCLASTDSGFLDVPNDVPKHLWPPRGGHKLLISMVRPARLERATFWFVAKRSIQLSYGRF